MELLIVIVVIAILAAISIVAYNGIQSRATDARIKTAASQVEKAVQLFYLSTGKPPYSGYGSSGTISNDTCPGSTAADGFTGSGNYACTLEDLLIANAQIPGTLISSLPPNRAYGGMSGLTFMFYQCGSTANNQYALYWYLQNPSSEDSSRLNATLAVCGNPTSLRDVYGMRAGRTIQL